MKQLQQDIRIILKCANTETFEERKAYNRLLDFIQIDSIYDGIPVEDSCDNEYGDLEWLKINDLLIVVVNTTIKVFVWLIGMCMGMHGVLISIIIV